MSKVKGFFENRGIGRNYSKKIEMNCFTIKRYSSNEKSSPTFTSNASAIIFSVFVVGLVLPVSIRTIFGLSMLQIADKSICVNPFCFLKCLIFFPN